MLSKVYSEIKSYSTKNLFSVIGAQWGDEGKGKIVDFLAQCFDIVARFNGGANAGHTIYIKNKKYAFHSLPCGVLYNDVLNIIGNGMVIDHKSITNELNILKNEGFDTECNLRISDRAHLLFGFHKILDVMQETSMGFKKIGTTKKGIGPCYATKSARLGLRVGDLINNFDLFEKKYKTLLNFVQNNIDFEYDADTELNELHDFRKRIQNLTVDTGLLCHNAIKSGKRILAEGANATMLDINFGSYPFVTSSNTTSSGIYSGLGIASTENYCIGVIKAYTTRVGSGPFPTEIFSSEGDLLSEKGNEIGTTTGRKRRIGWLDIPMIQYSMRLNGFDAVNLTKLDVLSGLDAIRIGIKYVMNGKTMEFGAFPSTLEEFNNIKVVYETFPGWKENIKNVRKFDDLPPNAIAFVNRIEELIGVDVKWIGVDKCRTGFIVK